MSVALIVIIGVPAALIGFREQPTTPERTPEAPSARYSEPAAPVAQNLQEVQPPPTSAEPAPPVTPPPTPQVKDVKPVAPPSAVRAQQQASEPSLKASNEAPTLAPPPPVVAAPPAPPPPPPSPPAPAARSDSVAQAANSGQIVVTGSIMTRREAAPANGFDAKAAPVKDSYAGFLSQLQRAVRANDRDAVVGLIDFPLRVNAQGTSRTYRDAESVERDYDRIFTSKVRRAILRQRAAKLFVRDQGAMIGDGEVWFDHSCANSQCSPLGPVRIKAVNP
jgi:outer membrane biosynthesis protein TonB